MEHVVVDSSHVSNHKLCFPSWMGASQKVMYLHEGIYLKGIMEYDLDEKVWRFSQKKRNDTEIWGVRRTKFPK